ARDDHVEAAIGERQRAQIAARDLDTYTLRLRIFAGGSRPIARLVTRLPQIDAHHSTAWHPARRRAKEQPPATACVQHALVPAPAQAREDPLALPDFPEPARQRHRHRIAEKGHARPEKPGPAQE